MSLVKIPSFANQNDFQENPNYFEKQQSTKNLSQMFYSRNLGAFSKVQAQEGNDLVVQPPRPGKQSSIMNLRNLPKPRPTDSMNSFQLVFNADLSERPTTRSTAMEKPIRPKVTES